MTQTTTLVDALTNIGTIENGDYLVGERTVGTTIRFQLTTTGTGLLVLATSPIISNPTITDANGNNQIIFSSVANATNYLNFTNSSSATGPVYFTAQGASSSIGIDFFTKGGDGFLFSTASGTPFKIQSGTNYQHTTSFVMADTAEIQTYTFPDVSGTFVITPGSTSITTLGTIGTGTWNATAIGIAYGGTGLTSLGTGVQTALGTNTTGTGGLVRTSSPTITSPVIATSVLDTNSNNLLAFTATSNAVNYFTYTNSSTGTNPIFSATGSDTNVGLIFSAQAAGGFVFKTTASSGVLVIQSGTSYQHSTFFNFNNSSASRTLTIPDASGVVQLQSQSLATAPGNSTSSSLVLGTAYQNTSGSDILLTVYFTVGNVTNQTISAGVGPTSTPTQQTIMTVPGAIDVIITVPLYIPSNYYALLSMTGTALSISGQHAMPI